MNNNNMEKWAACTKCQKSCIATISYAFNITLLIVIIVKDYLSSFISICLLSKMLHNLRLCILLEDFSNFLVDPYYDPLSWVMIVRTTLHMLKKTSAVPDFLDVKIRIKFFYLSSIHLWSWWLQKASHTLSCWSNKTSLHNMLTKA